MPVDGWEGGVVYRFMLDLDGWVDGLEDGWMDGRVRE